MRLQLYLVLTATILLLESLQGSRSQPAEQSIRHNHTCDFEALSNCGWVVNSPSTGQGTTGISTPQQRPPLGPLEDVTGSQTGELKLLVAPELPAVTRMSCMDGPTRTIFPPLKADESQNATGVGIWRRETLNFNSSEPFNGILHFEVAPYDIGEAPEDPSGYDLFLGLDDISITFCLPCDYDALGLPGSLSLTGPENITIRLRITSKEVYNGTSSLCPNEPLEYHIVSADPPQVSSIFSLDPMTGVLLIQAQGFGLEPTGVHNGSLEIGVYIPGSNYANISPPISHTLLISFTQPPTITHTAPISLAVKVGSMFSYHFSIASALGQTLTIGELTTDPHGLVDDVSIVFNGADVTVSGNISLIRDLPLILTNDTTPSIHVPIMDSYGFLVAATQLTIQQSPPIFAQSHYEFSSLEGSSGAQLGPIHIADPNGDVVTLPEVLEEGPSKLFRVILLGPSGIFTVINLLTLITLNYEQTQEYNFHIEVQDSINASLTSQASVRVLVLPVNEYTPVFMQPDYSVEISDVEPRGHFVAEFNAVDGDSGADGHVTYSITSGNDEGFFVISVPTFGEVSVARTPILPHTYTLTVTATDGGSPPRSADVTLTVQVIATHTIDCADAQFGPPMISEASSNIIDALVTTNATLTCDYNANPIVRVYKWDHRNGVDNSEVILDSNEKYTVNLFSLVLHNLTTDDAGVYECNVTNQCGSQTQAYLVNIIDYPDPPRNPQIVSGPDSSSFSIIWDAPLASPLPNSAVTRPLDGFEVRVRAGESTEYQTVSSVDTNILRVNITGLHPGAFYYVVVASVNAAGSTLSSAVNFTTTASAPKLRYFTAVEQANHSVLIEWELQYDGGSSIISFEIHVILQEDRAKRDTPDLVYHVNVDSGLLVTRGLQVGRSYTIMATLHNALGSSEPEFAYVYVGPKDSLHCGFESTDCYYWQLDAGEIISAQDAPLMFFNTDSDSNTLGHFVSAQSSLEDVIIMSYARGWYSCGYSFAYYLSPSANLRLETSSGSVLWSSSTSTTGQWVRVNSEGEQFLLESEEEILRFVLQGSNATAGIGDVALNFCLPCDFPLLQMTGLNMTYPTNVELFLRTEQTLSLSADVLDCSSALLEFSIIRVIPSELESSFSVTKNSFSTATISVGAISSDRVLPHTPGYIEVSTSVVHSDYQPDSNRIGNTVLIEFILQPVIENCSLSQSCDFEGECSSWSIGSGVQRLTGPETPVQELASNQGHFLYGDYTSTTLSSNIITSSHIGDTFCAVSFSYSAPPTSELLVSVDGLGQIWTSLLVSTSLQWNHEVVPIDLESASLSSQRELVFSARQSDIPGVDTALPIYAALDNITLHPCIDCNTPECFFTSCTPGRYFTLEDESCAPCPRGHYCPDWRDLPIPCPPGTFSDVENGASATVCETCAFNTYSLIPGSTSCEACPPGYSCMDSTHFPVSENQCPTATPARVFQLTEVIVGATVGGVALLLCLLLSCVIACWCYRSKKERKQKQKQWEGRLASADMLSIGSAGSLGRSSVATFDSHGRRWKKGRDVSTLMSFLNDEDEQVGEESWDDTEQLTLPRAESGLSTDMTVIKNDTFEGDDELQLINIGDHGDYQSRRETANVSQF